MPGIGAIVLAAGASQRFGADNKLLASIGGEPLVRRVVQALVRGGIADIVVVTGHERALIEAALDALPVRFAHNENWASGMASSIVTGVSALPAAVDGAFIVPGDMPFLTAAVIERLTEVFDEHGRTVDRLSGDERRRAAQSGAVAAALLRRPRSALGTPGSEAASCHAWPRVHRRRHRRPRLRRHRHRGRPGGRPRTS